MVTRIAAVDPIGLAPPAGSSSTVAKAIEWLRLAARRPPDGIGRVRWLLLLFALTVTAATLPPVIRSTGAPGLRALAVAGLLWLCAHRVAEYRRGALSRPGWDVIEAAVLLLAAFLSRFDPALALFYVGLFFRASLGTGRRVLAGAGSYVAAIVLVGVIDKQPVGDIGYTVLGLCCAALLTYTMARTLVISLRKLTRESQRAHHILDAATDPVVQVGAGGSILEWNAQAIAVFGWPRDDVIGRSLVEVLAPAATHPASHTRLQRALVVQAGSPAVSRVEVEVGRRDGSSLVAEVSIWPIGDGDDLRINAMLHDLTDRRNAEAELAEAHARFRYAFDNAPIGMMLAGLGGELIEVNRAFCEMLGRSEAELLAIGVVALTHPADRAATREVLSALASAAVDSVQLEKRYLHADGRSVLTNLSASLIRDGGGAPRFIVAQSEDITERRATERALALERAFTEAVLEEVDTGVVACNADGVLTVFNRATREMHGLPAEPLPPQAWSEYYDLFRPDGVTPLPTSEIPLFRALNGEQVRNVEMIIAPRGAEPRTLLVNSRRLAQGDGTPLGAVVAMNDVTERRRAEAALNWQVMHDPLTGRANRLLLRDRLIHALNRGMRQRETLALLVLDLDGFKAVNDSLGNEAGDLVLVAVADRLRQLLRPEDTVARIDGDEFAIILENTSPLDAVGVAAELLAGIRAPISTRSRVLRMEASVGVYVADSGCDAEEFLRNASLAMYAAKSSGKGNVQVYEASMHEEVLEQLTLQAELQEAVATREFVVHYQPVYSLPTGRLQGFEALVRWNHPRRGLVAPAAFISLAETTGLIVPLGSWVLEEACQQVRRWQIAHPEPGELRMAVNLSVRQLQDPSIVETVGAALTRAGLPARQLVLEITESGIMHRGPGVEALNRLHDLGVRLAIDDFGTGYSSLSRLHALPVDQVKIDKSFIDQISCGQPSPVVAATIAIAHSLGLETVAEGVDNPEQLPFLRLHGCDHVQGYLFSPPVTPAAVDKLLEKPFVTRLDPPVTTRRLPEPLLPGPGRSRPAGPAPSRRG